MPVPIRRVMIIGAGIGGLCTAIALRQLGMEVEVYEQAPAFGEVGAGLTLWANAIKGLRRLGIAEADLGGSRVCRSELLDRRGRVLSAMQVEELEPELGAPSLAVHRADLHRVLIAALPEGTVQTNAACTGFEQNYAPGASTVTVHFANRSAASGDMLVGADGIHSVVRKKLFPAVRLRYGGYPAWRGVVTQPGFDQINSTSETWGRGARFGIVPIGSGRIYWFATANLPAGLRRRPAEHKADLLRRFHGWHAPVEEIIAATPEEKILYNDILDFPPFPRWSQGCVTLLGDAAHPTTPNMGQGACQAIESSLALACSLTEENDLPAALQRYEQMRRPRAAWITNTSWQLGKVAQVENPILCAVRDWVMRMTPDAVMKAQIVKSAGYQE
jgi:2-polyprenyl-6-methoxyphenol hydroxylase-like FAD-dependent oxidoreductase